ncbi:MAG: 1-acyl-sn-glycerol-3-phosphate acyltransferase [Odoribacteraceae bacterium]|jgi:hypothetical protein|nr:1-acyl-sn-glycerol-3-phosphate acyltransferase [Odoribacteraceae bacterium]
MEGDPFDDLRPYRDAEIAPAMRRVVGDPLFPALSSFVYPGRDVEEVKAMIRGYTTVDQFQAGAMSAFVERVIARSISRFSCTGLDGLDPGERYLFVSNHRDIVLDSSLLQYALHRAGHRTTEISFGSNLMTSPLAVDIGKSNKMFTLLRGGNARELPARSRHLSAYIRHALLEKRESVWIAQRNGRAKDGRDVTERGIIKMFRMSAPGDPVDALAALRVVPVSVSYQWEPCDALKAMEVYRFSRAGSYTKRPGEDLESILAGITRPKGEVHLHAGTPLSRDALAPLAALPGNAFNARVAALVDEQVTGNYRLTCNNYIAHDLRSSSGRHAGRYTPGEREAFIRHYRAALPAGVEDRALLEDIFLGIYANPVDARERLERGRDT